MVYTITLIGVIDKQLSACVFLLDALRLNEDLEETKQDYKRSIAEQVCIPSETFVKCWTITLQTHKHTGTQYSWATFAIEQLQKTTREPGVQQTHSYHLRFWLVMTIITELGSCCYQAPLRNNFCTRWKRDTGCSAQVHHHTITITTSS